MKYTPEQVKARIREGKYNFDFEGTKRGNETRRPAEEIQNEIRNKTYQGIDYDHIAEIKRQVAKNNSYSSNKSNAQSAARKAADYNAGRANNNMSYDEKKEYLKQQKSQARKEKWRATASATLDSILGQITINEDRVKSAKADYDTAHTQYDAAKKALEDLEKNKWNETQEENSRIIDSNSEVKSLVIQARNAKINADAAQSNINNSQRFLGSNNISDTLGLQEYGKSYQSSYNEYQTIVDKLNDMGYDAESLIDTYTRQQNKTETESLSKDVSEFADKHPVLSGGAYVALNSAQSSALPQMITEGVTNTFSDEYVPYDTNTAGFGATNIRDTIVQTNSEKVYNYVKEKTDSETAANLSTLAYQTGLSMGDFLSIASLPEPVSLAVMGTSAAVSTAKDATERGVSSDKALLTALAAGTAEIVCEKISLENFNALKATGKSGVKNTVMDVLKQSFTEGSEEVFTDILNAVSDQIINGDNSALEQQYHQLVESGMTENEALRQVASDFGRQVGESFLGGALSGGVLGSGVSAMNNIKASSDYRAAGEMLKNGGKVQAEIDKGLSAGTQSKAYRAAQALQNSLEQNAYDNHSEEFDYSSLSSRKVGRLADYNAQTESKMLDDGAKVYDGDTAKSYVYAYSDNGYNGNVADYSTGFGAVYMAQQQGKNFDEAYQSALDNGSHITPIQAEIAYDAAKNDMGDKVKYSLNPDFVKQYDNWDKVNPRTVFNIGTTSTALQTLGLQEKEILWDSSKIVKIKNSHPEMSDEIIKQVPNIIEEPIVVMKSKTKTGRLTMFGEVYSAENKPILAVVELNPNDRNGFELNAFKLASAYGKDNAQKFLNSSDIVYTEEDKKRVSRWEKRTGLQLPVGSSVANSDINIAQNKNDVNNHSMQNNQINASDNTKLKTVLESPVKVGATVLAKRVDTQQQKTIDFIGEMAKMAGVEVVIPARMQDVGLQDANGAYVNGKIVLPLDNQGRMMNVYLGHEMFHHFKNNVPENADVLQNYIMEKLKSDVSYNYEQRLDQIINDYGFKGTREQQVALAEEEMAANACFTVFAEEQNVKQLVAEDVTLAQKVRDFFVNLIDRMKKALEGLSKRNQEYMAISKDVEAKEQIVSMFNDCLKESQKNNTVHNDSEIKLSIKEDEFGKYVDVDTDQHIVENKTLKESISIINKYMDKKFRGKVFPVSENSKAYVGHIGVDEYSHPARRNVDNDILFSKLKAGTELDNLLAVSVFDEHTADNGHHPEAVGGWDYYSTVFKVGNDFYQGRVSIEIRQNGREFKDITKIKRITRTANQSDNSPVDTSNSLKRSLATTPSGDNSFSHTSVTLSGITSTDNVSQSETSVNSNDMQDKPKYSLKEDSEGKKLSEQQQEYFKDSKAVDENGNLQVVYHGTTNKFTVFDRQFGNSEGDWGKGFYFTTEYDDVEQNYANEEGPDLVNKIEKYAERLEMEDEYSDLEHDDLIKIAKEKYITSEPNVIEAYLNIKNPARIGESETWLDFNDGYDYETDEYINEPSGLLYDFVHALEKNVDEFEYWGNIDFFGIIRENTQQYYEEVPLSEVVKALKENIIDEIMDENGDIAINELIRMSLEEIGFDGIIDTTVNEKFSSMNGLYENTTHYIVFNSNQAKNTDNLNPTENEDIRYSRKESIDVDEFDESGYDIINTTGKKGYTHFKSEVMTWDSDKYLDKIRLTRIDDKFYIYKMVNNDSRDIWIYKPKSQQSKNQLKEMREYYAARNYKGSTDAVEIVRNKRRYSNGNNELFGGQREKSRNNDKLNNKEVRGEGNRNRRRTAQNDSDDYLQEERYSIKEQPIDFNAVLEENAELSSMNEELKKMLEITSKQNEKLKNQFKITDRHNISNNAVDKVAAALRKQYSSTYNKTDLVSRLSGLYDYIANAGANVDMGYIWQSATGIAKNIIANTQHKDTTFYDEYKELRRYIRNTDIRVPQNVKDDFADYDDFRKSNFGRLRLSDNGVELDSFYNELAADYPEFFDSGLSETEQLEMLADFFEVTSPVYYDVSKQNAESMGLNLEQYANIVAGDIFDKYFDVPEVMTAAEKHQKEITEIKTHYRNRISNIRQSYKNRYDERLKEVKEENAKRVTKLRKEKADALIKQKSHFEGVSQRGKERREKSKLRASIRKSLNKIVQLGSNPDKKKHIPNSIVDSVKNLAEAIVLDNTKQDDKIAQKLTEFKSGFEHIPDGSQYSVISELYTDYIQERIIALEEKTGNKPLKQLSVDELKEIDELIKMTVQSINNINRLFIKGRNETIDSYVNKVSEELKPFKKEKIFDGMTKSLMYNSMKPEYFFQYLGSDTLLELYHDLRAGEDTWAVDVSDARKFAVQTRKKYGYKNWDSKTVQTFNTSYGDIELTLQERLAVYANSIGEHTKNHLLGGGFVYQKSKSKGIQNLKKKRNDSSNHRLAESDVESIVSSLDENQKAYVRDMISYLSDVMGVKGNEVTKVLYGIELFREKMYYPAKIDKKSRHNSPKEFKAEQKIKNAGFTNSAIKNAPQPVELINFDDVWAAHVDEMSKYHAFVLPLENIDRVYNQYQTDNHEYSSVKEIIENAYGDKALTYIDDLISGINGGVVQEAGVKGVNKAISKFKKGAVFASASVAIQQPSAIARALSEVDAKYFAKVTGRGFSRKSYNEMKQYAPVAIIKEMGYFDTNMAQSTVDFLNNNDYEGIKEKVKAFVKDGSYRDEALSFFASKADEITWTHIWNACKAEVRAKNSDLAKEEILEKTGERFTEVITKTQVYDSVFSRSGLMRSRDNIVKSAAAFMAEPTTSLNMLVNAVVQAKRGKISKAQGARVFGSLVAASAMNSLLQSVVTAARADDDDKDWAEVYLAQLIPNFIDNLNPFKQIVFLKDIINIFQGYDVTRADMNLVLDSAKALKALNSDKISTSEKMKKLAGAISAFFGLPVKNILRDLDSVKNVLNDFFDDKKFSVDSTYDLFKEEMNSLGLFGVMNNLFGFELFNADLDVALKAVEKGDTQTYQEYADKIYATDDAYDLLYGVLKKYGYNSSQYAAAKEKCINVKKNNGAKNPNPDDSMKGKALKEYAKLKENGTYEQAEKARQLCIQLYGDMTKVDEALKKLND